MDKGVFFAAVQSLPCISQLILADLCTDSELYLTLAAMLVDRLNS